MVTRSSAGREHAFKVVATSLALAIAGKSCKSVSGTDVRW